MKSLIKVSNGEEDVIIVKSWTEVFLTDVDITKRTVNLRTFVLALLDVEKALSGIARKLANHSFLTCALGDGPHRPGSPLSIDGSQIS